MNYFFSPLEQFQVLPIFSVYLNFVDFSLTNETVILVLILFFSLVLFTSLVKEQESSYFIVPNRWQSVIVTIYNLILSLVTDNIKNKKNQHFFPLVFSIFFLLLSINLIGLIPYSFTLTSHLIVTLTLSLSIFIGINIICVRLHGINFFSLFFPACTSVVLSFLLVPI